MFLTLMVVGLVGLVMMAVPALGGHRHLVHVRTHGHVHAHGTSPAHHAAHTHAHAARDGLRFLPSPRAVFSVSALYGAFGNALVRAAHLTDHARGAVAVVPALLRRAVPGPAALEPAVPLSGPGQRAARGADPERGRGGRPVSQRARASSPPCATGDACSFRRASAKTQAAAAGEGRRAAPHRRRRRAPRARDGLRAIELTIASRKLGAVERSHHGRTVADSSSAASSSPSSSSRRSSSPRSCAASTPARSCSPAAAGTCRSIRGPCKALIVPVITQVRVIPAQAINVDIEITDQTADVDANGRSAPVKVTVRPRPSSASARTRRW